MQLSRSKLRASPLRPADKSASCLPSRVIAARASQRKKKPEKRQTQGIGRDRRVGDDEVEARRERYRAEDEERGGIGQRRRAQCAWRLACMRARASSVFTLYRISVECGRGCTVRGCARVLHSHPFPSSSPFPAYPAADRLSPRGPRTNNCRPVNSRYDTREERYTYFSSGNRRRSSRLPRYKNEIRRGRLAPRAKNCIAPRKNWPLRYFTPSRHAAPAREYRLGTRALFVHTAIGSDGLMPV